MYFDMTKLLQGTEAQSIVNTIQCNLVDLWSGHPSLVWSLEVWSESIFLLVVIDSSNLGLHKSLSCLSLHTLK